MKLAAHVALYVNVKSVSMNFYEYKKFKYGQLYLAS